MWLNFYLENITWTKTVLMVNQCNHIHLYIWLHWNQHQNRLGPYGIHVQYLHNSDLKCENIINQNSSQGQEDKDSLPLSTNHTPSPNKEYNFWSLTQELNCPLTSSSCHHCLCSDMSGTDKMAAFVRPPLEDFTSEIGAITTASVTQKIKSYIT